MTISLRTTNSSLLPIQGKPYYLQLSLIVRCSFSLTSSRFSIDNIERITMALSRSISLVRQICFGLTEIDWVYSEECLYRTLSEYENVISTVTVPMLFIRRSGQILKASDAFAYLVDIPPQSLISDDWKLYELVTEDSVVNFYEKVEGLFMDSSNQDALISGSVLVRRGLRLRNGPNHADLDRSQELMENIPVEQMIPTGISVKLRKDPFGLPLVYIISFIPLDDIALLSPNQKPLP